MKSFVLTLRLLCVVLIVACSAPASGPARPDVPPVFAPSFALLDSVVTSAERDTLRRVLPERPVQFDSWVFMSLSSRGVDWLRGAVFDSLGAHGVHPEEMSHAVLHAYALHLSGHPVDLTTLIAKIPPSPTGYKLLTPTSDTLDEPPVPPGALVP